MTRPFSLADTSSTVGTSSRSILSDDSLLQQSTPTKTSTVPSGRKRSHPSILVLGASSRIGLECIIQLSNHPSMPYIHAFCEEDMPELDDEYFNMCHTVIEGSMRHAVDIAEALRITGANWVVLCNHLSEDETPQQQRPKDHSTVSAKNLVNVLERKRFTSVRVLVVSRIEAATSAKGRMLNLKCKLRLMRAGPMLKDIVGQEIQMHQIWDRTTVVRTTRLIDSPTSSNDASRKKIVELSDEELSKSIKSCNCSIRGNSMERTNIASYIVDEICSRSSPVEGNRVINVMSVLETKNR